MRRALQAESGKYIGPELGNHSSLGSNRSFGIKELFERELNNFFLDFNNHAPPHLSDSYFLSCHLTFGGK